MTPSVVIADDHPLFREAITLVIRQLQPSMTVFETDSLKGLITHLQENRLIRLILLDLSLADSKGMEGLLQLKNQFPNIPVVIVSACDDPYVIQRSIDSGAIGFIPKTESMSSITKALQDVISGKKWLPKSILDNPPPPQEEAIPDFSELTPTQLKVLMHLKDGENNKSIANSLFITEATVKAHITAIFRKLNVRNRTQAVIAARHLDIPNN